MACWPAAGNVVPGRGLQPHFFGFRRFYPPQTICPALMLVLVLIVLPPCFSLKVLLTYDPYVCTLDAKRTMTKNPRVLSTGKCLISWIKSASEVVE